MKRLCKVLIVLIALALVSGCGNTADVDDESGSASAIKIGASGPLTGSAAAYGTDVMHAMELAIKEINEKEGTEFFVMNFQDDEADPEKSPNAYGVLKDWGMQISLYTVTSGAGLAVAQDYVDDGIFALTPSGSNPGLVYSSSENYKNCFQLCFSDPNQGIASADYISQYIPDAKTAVIYRSDDDYSTSIYSTFISRAQEIGLEIVCESSFIDGDADYSSQLIAAQNAGANVIFLPIYYSPASSILTQANNMGYAPLFFGVDGMDGILGIEGFDVSLAEGVYLLTPFAADAKDEATVNFVNSFKETYGTIPNQFAADAYDCIYSIYQACKAGNITADMTPQQMCDILIQQFTSMTFEGLTGTATWNEKGEVSKSPKAVIISNGVYTAAE